MWCCFCFFSSRRRHTRLQGDWSSDVCSTDLQSATEGFGSLLRQTVATIDEHGLRRHYLRRHRTDIDRYFEALAGSSPQSEAAQAIRDRLLRYRKKLFTFVDHDDVAWNNN